MRRFGEYTWYHKHGDSAANPRVLAEVCKMEHMSQQERADLCYFYSLTYCVASALRIMQDRDSLLNDTERTAAALRPALLFQSDRRYVACNKMFERALMYWRDNLSENAETLGQSLVDASGSLSFAKAIPIVESFPSFGRYAAYLYAETYETVLGLPLSSDFSHVEYDSGRVFTAGLLHLFELDESAEVFEKKNLNIHVPEGAIPKDGPSAGITMVTSIVSTFTGREVKERIAMTGEMTLRGRVMPVGGIKEKILAAKRAGICELILCEDNRKDVEEIKPDYLAGLTFHYVKQIDEVLALALK